MGTSTTHMVDMETQTDISENDMSPNTAAFPTKQPQRVILQDLRGGASDEEDTNTNRKVQLHYMVQRRQDDTEGKISNFLPFN